MKYGARRGSLRYYFLLMNTQDTSHIFATSLLLRYHDHGKSTISESYFWSYHTVEERDKGVTALGQLWIIERERGARLSTNAVRVGKTQSDARALSVQPDDTQATLTLPTRSQGLFGCS